MKVILTENVNSLGNVGEMVNVSPGFARNYLIPRQFAVVADERNKRALEDDKKRLSKKMDETKKEALALKGKLEGLTLEFQRRVAGNGKLFGAVSSFDVSKVLEEKGIQVEKRLLTFPIAAKSVGTFEVKANLFQDVQATFKVKIEMDQNQAEEIRKKQELAEKRKKAKADKAEGEEDGVEASADKSKVEVEQTEEERLREETNKILRG